VDHQCGAKLTPERMMEASISSPIENVTTHIADVVNVLRF